MTSPIETNNVVERLLRTELDQFDDQDDRGDALKVLVNPDGPEAADLIQSLSDRIDVLEGAAQRVVDSRVGLVPGYCSSVLSDAIDDLSVSLTQGGKK